MPESLEDIFSSREAAPEETPVVDTAPSVDQPTQESPQEGDTQEQAESLRGSAAQLAARDKARDEALAAQKRELDDEWRRRLASEIPRQTEAAIQEYVRKQQQQQQPKLEVWDDPEKWGEGIVNPRIDSLRAEFRAQQIETAKHTANFILGGEDARLALETAYDRAVAEGKISREENSKVLGSAIPWVEAQRLLQRQEKLSDDYDQKLEAKFREKYGISEDGQPQQSQAPAQQRQPVMPSDMSRVRNVGPRNGPVWGGPAPINDIFARKRSG